MIFRFQHSARFRRRDKNQQKLEIETKASLLLDNDELSRARARKPLFPLYKRHLVIV